MLIVASDCSTLRTINHYVRKEALKWDIPHSGLGRTLLQSCLCHRDFPLQRIYDKPLLRDGRYRTLPMWEVNTVAKCDMQGLRGGRKVK
jgi:hypothetical protein